MREFSFVDARIRTQRPWATGVLVWAGLAVSALFTYLALRNVRFGLVWDGLRGSTYWWVIPSVALLVVAQALRGLRWQLLFPPATRPPFLPVLAALLLGQFFNSVLPARAGEAARVVALNQSARTSRAEIVATVVVERVYDVLGLLVLFFVILPWLPGVSWVRAAAILAIVVVAATLVVVLVLIRFEERPLRRLLRPLALLPLVSVERTEQAAASLHRGAASILEPVPAAVATVLTAASWMLFGLSAWVLMLGFDFGLSPLAGMLVIIAIGLFMIIPSSPGAIGVFETAALVALNAYGVPKSAALGYALVLHVVNFVPYVAAGAVVLLAGRRPRIRS